MGDLGLNADHAKQPLVHMRTNYKIIQNSIMPLYIFIQFPLTLEQVVSFSIISKLPTLQQTTKSIRSFEPGFTSSDTSISQVGFIYKAQLCLKGLLQSE